MIQELIKKILSWDRETADKFNKNQFNSLYDERDYLYEITDHGIYLWRDITALFFNNDGRVFKLTTQWYDGDIEFHHRLYERTIIDANFRVEIPLHNELVDINGISFMYTIVKRPNNELGYDDFEHVLKTVVDTDYFIERVHQYSVLLTHIKYIHKKYTCQLPKIIPKRTNDSIGIFWNDFKECKVDLNFFISVSFTKLYRMMLSYESMYAITMNKTRILDIAEKLWK